MLCCVCTGQRGREGLQPKKVHALGRCIRCYQYRIAHGWDRSVELVEREIEREQRKAMSLTSR
jgi:hypothetical protein